MIADILIKAAEDVQSGMLCKGTWFQGKPGLRFVIVGNEAALAEAGSYKRCAEGSIVYATALLGGTIEESAKAIQAVNQRLKTMPCNPDDAHFLAMHNDHCLPDDSFSAGQQLADLFRSVALEVPNA